MAARPADEEVPMRDGTEVVEIKGLPPLRDAALHPVVSVSPKDAEPGVEMSDHKSPDRDVFLAPRVLDQTAFDELSETLRALIGEARAVVDELGHRMDDADQRESSPAQASAQLQERLRLGARMLKAFQGQIARVEESLATLRTHQEDADTIAQRLDEALLAFDARVDEMSSAAAQRAGEAADEAIKKFEQDLADRAGAANDQSRQTDEALEQFSSRLSDLAGAAMKRLDGQIALRRGQLEALKKEVGERVEDQIEARIEERLDSVCSLLTETAQQELTRLDERINTRREELSRLDDRINESVSHADSLLKMVELAEQKSSAFVHRQAAMAVEIEAKSAEAKEIIRQCFEARKMLDQALLSAADRIDEIDERSEDICRRSEAVGEASSEALSKAEEASSELVRQTAEAATIGQALEHTASARLELRLLLEQLGPWQRLLLDSERTPDGTPRPVASMIETLRDGVASDLLNLSQTMRDLAERVERVVPEGADPEAGRLLQVAVSDRFAQGMSPDDAAGADEPDDNSHSYGSYEELVSEDNSEPQQAKATAEPID